MRFRNNFHQEGSYQSWVVYLYDVGIYIWSYDFSLFAGLTANIDRRTGLKYKKPDDIEDEQF